jgi:hypothetical protein
MVATRQFSRGAIVPAVNRALLSLVACLLLAPSAAAAIPYRDVLEQVTMADGYRYTTRDHLGRSMDTLKILRLGSKRYVGVYHTLLDGRLGVHVATSHNLVSWHERALLANNASQPTVARRPGGGYLVAYEKDSGCRDGNNCLAFRRYRSARQLLRGKQIARERRIPRTFSKCAEGTPNFFTVTARTFDIGFHFFKDCRVDRQARGTYDLVTGKWKPRTLPGIDSQLLAAGADGSGNIGDRDSAFYRPAGAVRGVYEAMIGPRSAGFGVWRCFAEEAGVFTQLVVRTHHGSTACANPTVTNARLPNGRPGLIVTYFIPVEGAGRNEAGTLVFWRTYG